MEDIMQSLSNEQQSIYYSVELKIKDISHHMRLMGTGLSENQLKISTATILNHFYMLESIFQANHIPHIYQLLKDININYNAIIAILLAKIEKSTLKDFNLSQQTNNKQNEQGSSFCNEQGAFNNQGILKEIKKNHLGGIHLFNQSYSRYIEDQTILEQIKIEKERRLQRKRLDLLQQSVVYQLNHKTDVEEFPANNDDIANYIIRTKEKDSVFNYVSYEPELQGILDFFQTSQNEANKFLNKKTHKNIDDDNTFSFADFQRDIQLKKSILKKHIIQKMKEFTDKYRNKQISLIQFFNKREEEIKQKINKAKGSDSGTQTDLNFKQLMGVQEQKVKQLEDKCLKLQYMAKSSNNQKNIQAQLRHHMSKKQVQNQKLTAKILELQEALQYVKQLYREEKIKKPLSIKDIPREKSRKILPDASDISDKIQDIVIEEKAQNISSNQENMSVHLRQSHKRGSKITSKHWKSKEVIDTASFLSFNELQKSKNKNDSIAQKDIKIKYEVSTMNEGNQQVVKLLKKQQKQIQSNANNCNSKQLNQQKIQDSIVKNNQAQSTIKPPQKKMNEQITVKSNRSLNSIKKMRFQSNIQSNPQNNHQNKIHQDIIVNSKKQARISINQNPSLSLPSNAIQDLPKSMNEKRKLDQNNYQIYQVAQEEPYKQTLSPSKVNSQNTSMKSMRGKQLIQNLNSRLNKITQNSFKVENVYNFTICPQMRHLKYQSGRLLTQQSQPIKKHNSQKNKILKEFDDLLRLQQNNKDKTQKIKHWRKVLLNQLKSQTINESELDSFMSIVKGTSTLPIRQHSSMHQKSSKSGNMSPYSRNSLALIQPIIGTSKIKLPYIKNQIKEKESNHQSQDKINQIDSQQFQQKLEDLIKTEFYKQNFSEKFHAIHKHCSGGPLCSHISKYFQAITKYNDQRKKKQRKSLVMPVQCIGNNNKIEEQAMKKQNKIAKSNKSQKQAKLIRKNYSLIRYSQQINFPNINDYKCRNIS